MKKNLQMSVNEQKIREQINEYTLVTANRRLPCSSSTSYLVLFALRHLVAKKPKVKAK